MLLRSLPEQTYRLHRRSKHPHESKILPGLQTCCSSRLPRNKSRKTAPKLHSRTLHNPNQIPILHTNKQPTDNPRQHEELENNPVRTHKQRTRRHKNKQRNTKQSKPKPHNRFSTKPIIFIVNPNLTNATN
jgi:hypothetical protein